MRPATIRMRVPSAGSPPRLVECRLRACLACNALFRSWSGRLLSHLKAKGVEKLKERKAFATLVEEKAS